MKVIIAISVALCIFSFESLVCALDVKSFPQVSPNSSAQEVEKYSIWIHKLTSDPNKLDQMSPWELKILTEDIEGVYIENQIPTQEKKGLMQSEVVLIGLIVKSLVLRVDPAISNQQKPPLIPPPYFFASKPEDRDNADKRAAYEANRQILIHKAVHIQEQRELKTTLTAIIEAGRGYLAKVTSIGGITTNDVSSLLRSSGVGVDALSKLTSTDK